MGRNSAAKYMVYSCCLIFVNLLNWNFIFFIILPVLYFSVLFFILYSYSALLSVLLSVFFCCSFSIMVVLVVLLMLLVFYFCSDSVLMGQPGFPARNK